MSLLAPLLLAGLIGLGLPLLAHLRGREEPRTIAFAGRRFLAARGEVLSQRRRLRDRLLLALRLLLLALVVVALSRPVTRHDAALAVLGEPHDAILLVDGSRSMGLRGGDATLFAAALPAAWSIAEALPAGSRLGLVGSDPALAPIEPSADPQAALRALADRLEAGGPRPGSWRLSDRLTAAATLGGDDGRPRVVYAIGDRTAGGLASLPPSADGDVAVIPVAVDGPLDAAPGDDHPTHLGIAAATWEPAPEVDPRALRIRAEVRAYGPADPERRRRARVALKIAGETITQAEVEVPAGGAAPLELTYTAAGERGPLPATLELVDAPGAPPDALPSDDRRHLWLAADERLRVTLVNGDPSEVRAHDELFFLATALAERGAGERERLALRNLAPDQLDGAIREAGAGALAEVDVLVLANVPAPAEDVAAAIRERVGAGMGLWLTVGERVDADTYNERLGELLPLLLREPVLAGTAPGRSEATGEGFAPANLDHPALRGQSSDLGLLGARARRIFLLEPDPSRGPEIALTYTSGAPTLLTRDYSRGRVALLTTSIDRDWSDLPLRPGFVPLAMRTIAYLGDRAGELGARDLVVGQPWVSALPEALTVVTPSGRRIALAADDDGVRRFTDTFEPGHYRVERGEASDADSGAAAPLLFTVNVDPRESETLPQVLAPPSLAGDRVLAAASVPRWRPLVGLAALVLLLESLLRLRRRRRALAAADR
jgi:hypothetical protein